MNQNNSPAPSGPSSDLRAAHSSDFFSGQRERGRDESVAPSARQSFRRTAARVAPTPPPSTALTQPPAPSSSPHYDVPSKRKLVRKRPIHAQHSTSAAPTTFTENYPRSFPQQPQQVATRRPVEQRTSQPSSPPPQYNEEYVEVSRVTPKANRYYSTPAQTTYTQRPPSTPQFTKKDGLTELYNYEAQSTSGFNAPNENRPFKTTLRNSFTVSSPATREFENVTPRKKVEINSNGDRRPTAQDYNGASKNFGGSTPSYRNLNSVSYEPEKNNFIQSGSKQSYSHTPTLPPTTTVYTTARTDRDHSLNFNTVAYKTNIGFDARPSNYADNNEDDGQYRLPAGEDDGQYRPELYERELLSGAHSLNIAASGNRLPDDQKPRPRPLKSQTAVPRPFSHPEQTSLPVSREPEPTYTTAARQPVTSTQRVFDFYQPYTTTSRPSETSVQNTQPQYVSADPVTNRPSPSTFSTYRPSPSTYRPTPQETESLPPRASSRSPAPAPSPSSTSRPAPRPPAFSQPANKKEDNSYDYAYYDSDPGLSEYDNIEEFGRTKTKA